MRRGGRVVEGARLESEYTAKPYRGFESLPLRQFFPQAIETLAICLQQAADFMPKGMAHKNKMRAEAHKNKMRGVLPLALPFVMQGPCFRRLLDEARPCGFGFLLGRTRSSLRTFL